ncbi:MAG: hydrogenase maturation nickel metallochaperone HypA [Saprospiraceae bacterium]|nr:hydrogenase maturation nickel metallochaperone HypA [Saprospiraceae bacterium]
MHELSIIQSIIDTVETEVTRKGGSYRVEAVVLQIGTLAGVETGSLEFLWPAAVQNTLLDGAECQIEIVPGTAVCSDCGTGFSMINYFDPCPNCRSHLINVQTGEELKIKTIELCAQPADVPATATN